MIEMRRGFLKTALLATAATTVGVSALASGEKTAKTPTNGVVIGKSKKKEITYTKTQGWEDFYKSAL